MWKRMLQKLFPPHTDEPLKAAARRETDRLKAELMRMDIRIELTTRRAIEQLEQQLREPPETVQ